MCFCGNVSLTRLTFKINAATLEPQRSPSREPSPSLSTATRNTVDSAPDSVSTYQSAVDPKLATSSQRDVNTKVIAILGLLR